MIRILQKNWQNIFSLEISFKMVELQNVNNKRNLVGKILIYSQPFFSFKYILAKTKTNKQNLLALPSFCNYIEYRQIDRFVYRYMYLSISIYIYIYLSI